MNLVEIKSKVDTILSRLESLKKDSVDKIYNTEELCEYLKVGKGTIDKYRQNGELAYAKLGRTIVYTQKDVDALIANNHINFVA